jgi:hypothetical protein
MVAVDTPTVVASGQVGFLDWVELKADTEASFTDWLTANGYPYSSAAASVFSYYVQKGWYFVAFRISQAGGARMAERSAGPWARSPCPFPPRCRSCRRAWRAPAAPPTSSGFSWRIFGITHGDVQLAFSDAN